MWKQISGRLGGGKDIQESGGGTETSHIKMEGSERDKNLGKTGDGRSGGGEQGRKESEKRWTI